MLRLATIVLGIALAAPATGAGQQTSLAIRGRVVDVAVAPVPGAEIELSASGRKVTSDAAGRFRIPDLPAGEHPLVVRAAGFVTLTFRFVVRTAEDPPVTIQLARVLPVQDTVIIAIEPAQLVAFERRRASALGHFVTSEQLDRAGSRTLGQYLRRLPTIRIGEDRVAVSASERVQQIDSESLLPTACVMRLVLNGNVLPPGTVIDVLPPRLVGGIEVYTASHSLPGDLAYLAREASCGLIVIWGRPGESEM